MDPTEQARKRALEGWDAILVAHPGPAGATLAWTLIWVAGAAVPAGFACAIMHSALPST